ncbi:MAG: MauE/DoxX family redox-associated membrane protein [Solirubrobacteraceae bacterium]
MSAALVLLLAGTFALAAAAKLRDPVAFGGTVGMVTGPATTRWVVRTLPVTEAALAVVLVVGVVPRVAAVVSAALLVAFTVALTAVERAVRAAAPDDAPLVPCNCFGAGSDGDPVGGRVRNLLLAGVAVALIVAPGDGLSAIEIEELAGAATVAIGAVCAWQLTLALWRLRPGAVA